MKQISYWLLALSSWLIVSCVDIEERNDSPTGNFEALWTILDEHYCFFDYKQKEYGLDWNNVYTKYKARVNNNMSTAQLFEVLCDMLGELRDGHVNLSSSLDYGRYWKWQENYPYNYSDSLIRHYLGTDYKIASGLRYRVLDDNIGYIRCASFESSIGEGNLDLPAALSRTHHRPPRQWRWRPDDGRALGRPFRAGEDAGRLYAT